MPDYSKLTPSRFNFLSNVLPAMVAFLLCFSATAQPISIKGTINSNELTNIQFTKLGVNSYLSRNVSFELPIATSKTFSGIFPFTEKGLYRIADGWEGHKVFITPNDTVQLTFTLLKKVKDRSGALTAMPRFHKMDVKTKYPGNYTYFDAIDGFFGQSVYPYVKEAFNAKNFLAACDSSYNAALSFLKTFYTRHIVSDTFYRYAKAELDARYILWICTPLTYVKKNTLPRNYLMGLNGTHFNDEDFLIRTDSYVTAASVYNMYVLNDFDPQRWYSNLGGEFHTAATCFRGLLRDQLMAWSIMDYKDKDAEGFDSLYHYFLTECRNTRIKNRVIQEVEEYRLKENSKPAFATVLEGAIVTDLNDKVIPLASLPTKKRWVLFDCWATWCIPCKKQLPFLKAFEKKYQDRIEFVFLSFDEKKELWQKFITQNNYSHSNQFIVKEGFKSQWANYFNLQTIPRYILIDMEKKFVVVKEMPMTTQEEAFETAITKVLRD